MSEISLLRLPEVCHRVGLSRTTIYDLARKGEFPAPIKVTSHLSAWRSDDVTAWITERSAYKAGRAARPKGSTTKIITDELAEKSA